MAVTFAEYATAFYQIIDGGKTPKAEFVKELLKTGLTEEDKDSIDRMFPTLTNDKGKSFIEKNKADCLRKYLRGENGIREIINMLVDEFDSEFQARYIDELQYYNDSKLIEFARRFHLDIDEDEIENVLKTIACLYTHIVKNCSASKCSMPNISEVNPKSEKNSIVHSYTFTESEKQAVVRLCDLIKTALQRFKTQTDIICNKRYELSRSQTSESNEQIKRYHKSAIDLSLERFDKVSSEAEMFCTDLIDLLEPKQSMNKDFSRLISFANNISNDKYRITCPEKFRYNAFDVMISDFNACIERTLCFMDKL